MIYNSKPFQRHIKLKNQQFLWQSRKKTLRKTLFLPYSLKNQKHLHTIPQVFLKSMQHFRRTSVNKIFVTQKGKVEGK